MEQRSAKSDEVMVTVLYTQSGTTHVEKPIDPEYPTRTPRTYCGKWREDVSTVNANVLPLASVVVKCGVCVKAMKAAGLDVVPCG
jgi:hypothetical protein